ncbi:monovalent cation/H(+) antiporter subunit G [Rubrobacter taiwanensis]|uniref:Monovalent cation/H(+) antiporter subunit G n=1 Tax=Rubrobacter taiwanensis TaxID=185139 RepID=A0A4V2NX39_9ACTN|nr:monovalent cation/H(+) antiporter subunit G [Rubrobacter taiwanensis]
MAAVAPWVADALVVLGVFIMTVGVYGMIRMPDIYTQMHAASKAVFLGVISFLFASMFSGDPAIIFRAALIAVFLILTTPVAAHMIAKAAYERGEKMRTPGAVDQSGRGLNREAHPGD